MNCGAAGLSCCACSTNLPGAHAPSRSSKRGARTAFNAAYAPGPAHASARTDLGRWRVGKNGRKGAMRSREDKDGA